MKEEASPDEQPTVPLTVGPPNPSVAPSPSTRIDSTPPASLVMSAPSLFHPGEGRFRIDGLLGEGGTSRVYAAMDGDLEREVALKVVPAEEIAAIEQFAREARVTSRLAHPNVPPVYDVGRIKEGYFLSLPRIRGRSLRAVIQAARKQGFRTALPPTELVEVLLKICDALAFAHAKGIVHQDIKPDNIMIGAFGEVMLVDWGAASVLGRDGDEAGKQVVGTPSYMAPEQALGAVEDPRFDVYGVGATLFHALLLRKPLAEPEKELFWERKIRGDLDWPTKEELSLHPRTLLAIARKAMHEDPAERYPSVIALASALRDFLAGGGSWSAPVVVETFADESYRERWCSVDGASFRVEGGELISEAEEGALLVYHERLAGSLALEFEGRFLDGAKPGDLSIIWTEDDVLREGIAHFPRQGSRTYCFQVGALSNHLAGIFRDFHQPLSSRSLKLEPGKKFRIRAEIEDRVMRLLLDGEVVAEVEERFPMRSGYLCLYAYYPGKAFSQVNIRQRGVPDLMSPLAIGDAFFTRSDFVDAEVEYHRVEAGQGSPALILEARYKRGVSALRRGDEALAFELFRGLEGNDYARRIELHQAEIAFSRGEHARVLSSLRSVMAAGDSHRATVVQRWSEFVAKLVETDDRPLVDYLKMRDDCFADEATSRSWAARAHLALGHFSLVRHEFSDERIEYCDALLALGEFDEVVREHGDMTGLRDATLVRQGEFALVSDHARSQPIRLIAEGQYEKAEELSDYTVAVLAAGKNEKLLSLPEASLNERVTALIRLGREDEALALGTSLGELSLGHRDEALSLARTLAERSKVQAFRAIEAFSPAEPSRFFELREEFERMPFSYAWEDYFLDRFFLLPLLAELAGARGEFARSLDEVVARYSRYWVRRADYLARWLRRDISEEEFLAQPAQGGVEARLHLGRAFWAELHAPEEASQHYRAFQQLPAIRRYVDSVFLDPVLEYFVRMRIAARNG